MRAWYVHAGYEGVTFSTLSLVIIASPDILILQPSPNITMTRTDKLYSLLSLSFYSFFISSFLFLYPCLSIPLYPFLFLFIFIPFYPFLSVSLSLSLFLFIPFYSFIFISIPLYSFLFLVIPLFLFLFIRFYISVTFYFHFLYLCIFLVIPFLLFLLIPVYSFLFLFILFSSFSSLSFFECLLRFHTLLFASWVVCLSLE